MPQAASQFSGIFICYRRDESGGHAGRLYDRLTAHFGNDQIFIDIDQIEPGEDFVQVIDEAIGSCEILLVVIGRNWLTSRDEEGRRLDNPKDFVRLEISAALQRNIRVIPVLVQGATMPRPHDLPDDLSQFSRRHALELSDQRWKHDVDQLIGTLERGLARRAERFTAVRDEAEHCRVVAEAESARAEENEQRAGEEESARPARDAESVEGPPAAVLNDARTKGRPALSRKPLLIAGASLCLVSVVVASWLASNSRRAGNINSVSENTLTEEQRPNGPGSDSQPVQSITPPIGQAEQNISPRPTPTATPTTKAQSNTNLRPDVTPTPRVNAPTPEATPKPTPKATPASASTPEGHYQRGVELWSSNRSAALEEFRAASAGGNYDAHYYLGLSYVEGRNLHSLKSAEVVAALQHFQLAQRGRQHVAESRRYQQQLENEFDRLKQHKDF